MRFKVSLAALFLSSILFGTSAADPKDKWFKKQGKTERKTEQSSEREAIAVPEPSAMLLSTLGVGIALMCGWYFRPRDQPSE